MSAIIALSLDHVHPVIDGQWHLLPVLEALPQPGEMITTLCGITETVEYQAKREQILPAHACWACDTEHRKRKKTTPMAKHALAAYLVCTHLRYSKATIQPVKSNSPSLAPSTNAVHSLGV